MLEEEQGRYRAALDRFRQALELRRELGDERAYAESLNNVGFAYFLLGDHDNAGVYWQRALELYQRGGNREGELVTRPEPRAARRRARRLGPSALHAFLGTLQTQPRARPARRRGGVAGQPRPRRAVPGALRRRPRPRTARRWHRVGELEDPRGLAELHLMAAEAALEVGLGGSAGEHLEKAGEWLRHGGNREQRAEAARLRGELALAGGDLDAARGWLAQAGDAAQESGSRGPLLAVAVDRARAELAAGDAAAAARAAGEAAAAARAGGMAVLELRALEVQAGAELAAGRARDAAATAARALATAHGIAPYGRAFELHRLHALAEKAAGLPGVAAAWKAAAREVARVRGDLHGDAATAFAALPAVVEIEHNAP